MKMEIREIIKEVRKRIWFFPLVYGLFSFVLSMVVIMVDSRYASFIKAFIPRFFYVDTSIAITVLGIIAGAFITITTFTFSTTMVVLTLYTSEFSPRVIENFLSNKNTTRTFGLFIGGFVYSIVCLLFIKKTPVNQEVISATIGVIYITYGLIYFSSFINSVGTYIQPSNLIDRLYSESLSKINEYKKFIEDKTIIPFKQDNYLLGKHFKSIKSKENGYIQTVDYQRILRIADEMQATIIFEKVTGQFLTDESRLMSIYYNNESTLINNYEDKLLSAVKLGDRKTEKQDFSFILQKIEEIAIRALSPGINDPNTAIHCIRIIGISLRNLGDLKKGYIIMKEDTDAIGEVYVEAFDFKKLIHSSFNQIMHYARDDYKVVLTIIKSLRFILEKANHDNKIIIKEYIDFIRNKINGHELSVIENSILNEELNKIESYIQ